MAWNMLAALMEKGKANPRMLGSGLAGQAASTLGADDEYRQHVLDAQEKGEEPMTRDQFIKYKQG